PGGRGKSPGRGPTCPLRERRENDDLGGALESLFDARSGDDVVAVAEAEGCLQRALLVPELVELVTQILELGGRGRVVTLGQGVPQLGPPLACLLDLLVDFGEGHVPENVVRARLIPEGRGRKRRGPRRPRRRPRS